MEPQTSQGQALIQQAQDLLDEIAADKEVTMTHADKLLDSMEAEAGQLEEGIDQADKVLEAYDQEVSEAIDEAILDSLEEEDTDID